MGISAMLAATGVLSLPLSIPMVSLSSSISVRGMRTTDVPEIQRIQEAAYPGILHERPAFYLNRLGLSATTCWVAQDATDAAVLLGYLVAYPWTGGLPPELDVPLAALPDGADHWFLHDCAVDPAAQGRGVGRALYEHARAQAWQAGLRHASLVALGSAASYWRGLGYTEPAVAPAGLADKLQGYGAGACYLVR